MKSTTMKKAMLRLVAVATLAVAGAGACGGSNGNGSPDMAMGQPACVMNPMTSVELLNACTTAQTGDPAKDAPYFPSKAPNGTLPPLP